MSTACKKTFLAAVAMLIFIFGFGCATMPPETFTPAKQPPEQLPEQIPDPSQIPPEIRSTIPGPEPGREPSEPAPRTIASLSLTEQARLLIESKQPDEAIRTLERSLNIDPDNGRSCYYLAEAWMLKGNREQAMEFNRMAGIYLEKDAAWSRKVRRQKERIENLF